MIGKKTNTFLTLILTVGLLVSFSTAIYGQSYQVKPGDSLYLISKRFGTSISSIQSINQLKSSNIYPGQYLLIPQTGQSSAVKYTVKPGDTLYLIAVRNNISLNDLRVANGIWYNNIWVGQTLNIPKSTSNPGSSQNQYTVRSGDSLFLIATKFGTTVNALKSANNLYSNSIYPGQSLRIPSTQNNGSKGQSSFSAADLELLAKLVRAEAEGEPYEGMVAVAASVLNRVKDPRYPNTIPEVVYQVVGGSYQYSPVIDGRINLAATSTARKAAQDAINGWDPSYGATGFYNPAKTTNKWVRSHPITTQIGDHVFFKY